MKLFSKLKSVVGNYFTKDLEARLASAQEDLEASRKENLMLSSNLTLCKETNSILNKKIDELSSCVVEDDGICSRVTVDEGQFHDIKNNLSAIYGLLSISDSGFNFLQEKYDINPHDLEDLRQINDAIKMDSGSALRFINKFYGGCEIKEVDDFNLVNIVENTRLSFNSETNKRPIKLNINYENIPDHKVFGRLYDLNDAVINLVGNAFKYTDSGSITISLTYNSNDLQHYITVEDTGRGIEPEKLDSIFDLHVRSKSSENTEDTHGTGLYQVRKNARAMGGEVYVESEVGVGSKFTLRIPFDKPKNTMVKGDSDNSNYSILLVEDNSSNNLMATKMIETLGYKCESVFNGEDALSTLENENFNLILMDYQLPDINGDIVTRIIRTDPKYGKFDGIPIIGFTSGSDNYKDTCRNAGMNDFLNKHAGLQDMENTFKKYLASKISDYCSGSIEEPILYKKESVLSR